MFIVFNEFVTIVKKQKEEKTWSPRRGLLLFRIFLTKRWETLTTSYQITEICFRLLKFYTSYLRDSADRSVTFPSYGRTHILTLGPRARFCALAVRWKKIAKPFPLQLWRLSTTFFSDHMIYRTFLYKYIINISHWTKKKVQKRLSIDFR